MKSPQCEDETLCKRTGPASLLGKGAEPGGLAVGALAGLRACGQGQRGVTTFGAGKPGGIWGEISANAPRD